MSEIGMELLERYLAGRVSAEERQRIDAWLAEEPRRWAELAALREAIDKLALSEDAVQHAMAEVWARLAPEIGAAEEPPPTFVRATHRGGRRFKVPVRDQKVGRRLVACVVVLMIGGGVAATLLLRSVLTPPELMRVTTTAPGERAAFRLPDGTQVMLGVASTLRYPSAFSGKARDIALEGEAYFDVAHQEERPFIVRAGGLVARDLGTRFTVRSYPEDASARVVVREGRVAIRPARGGVEGVVAPGQVGRLDAGRVPAIEQADTAALFAWTVGRLVFDGTPLRDALPQLGRWFGLEFRLADSALGEVPLSANLRTEPTPDVLESLAASLGMQQRRQGRTVTLYSVQTP
jgi:transmembrane sensor